MKIIITILALTLSAFLSAGRVVATDVPSFPSCNAPQGDVIAHYDSGVHGIVGDSATYTGTDSVYQVSATQNTQCFCSENGIGVQTNWWKISDLSENEIAVLKTEGWIYVPNGALWGLSEGPYLAKNSYYNCKPGIGGGDTSNNSGSSSNSSSNAIGGGDVLSGATDVGDVLGLAATGDIWLLYATFGIAFILLGTGARMIRRSTNRS